MKKLMNLVTVSLVSLLLFSCSGGEPDESKSLNLINKFIIYDNLEDVSNKNCKVVLLFGQSNASGISNASYLSFWNEDLHTKYSAGFSNVYINYNVDNFANASASFYTCRLGCGVNQYYFGPECGIAEVLNEAYHEEDVFILKYTYSGSILASQWLKGNAEKGGLYNCSINFVKKSLDYLIGKGYELDILGICWMQGESDAYQRKANYYENTKALVGYYRDDLSEYDNSIKFVDAMISESGLWIEHERINADKLRYSEESDLNYLVDTRDLTTNWEPFDSADTAHYDSISMAYLGERFGNCLKD